MRGSARCATCSSRTARCISWCMRRTGGPASTCCRSSADGSASRPPTTGFGISSPRSARCRPDIRWDTCCARRRTSGSEAALADALLHPQDRAYSVPQLFDFLDKAGSDIRPLGQAGALRPAVRRHGTASRRLRRLAQLPLAEQYAAVELFRGTMVRHSVVVYRDDSPGGPQPVSFAGDAWLGLCADSRAGHDLCSRAAAAGRRGGADQPDPHLHRHLSADRRAGEKTVRRHRRRTHASARSPGSTDVSTPRAPFSSGSGGTTRSCSTRHGNPEFRRSLNAPFRGNSGINREWNAAERKQ